ncbi:uncharacterized protein Gasu_65370 [Galdieria sulphuraria]|uniref:Uncharacterized protein n=1 Tax=Galdieria sulphuraria TaxID=130081 RepID=M2XQV2_GALSU|nr:uncharacterized protein Gasu_65370 [Galdieria sulphuraria]EME25804.1 hypothetical protein Gasu_65370 [Galdieria sulphuraria]|eukprot:XP_005702324.1 hypothetical protein Gasu_65370 [Galdieria sulphuraria]
MVISKSQSASGLAPFLPNWAPILPPTHFPPMAISKSQLPIRIDPSPIWPQSFSNSFSPRHFPNHNCPSTFRVALSLLNWPQSFPHSFSPMPISNSQLTPIPLPLPICPFFPPSTLPHDNF